MFKIFLSASSQEHNIGVDGYGTEEDNMFDLCDVIETMLIEYPEFTVVRNTKQMNLEQEVAWCNNNNCDVAVSNHSNAGGEGAEGTEIWWHKQGQALAKSLYLPISQVSVGVDRGVKRSLKYYFNANTNCPAVIIEHFFHSNVEDVRDFRENKWLFADAVVRGLCLHFEVKYKMFSQDQYQEHIDDIIKERDFYKNKFDLIKSLCYNEFRGDINEIEEGQS